MQIENTPQAYLSLGLTIHKAIQIRADAQHALSVMIDPPEVTQNDINTAILHIAQKDYAHQKDKSPFFWDITEFCAQATKDFLYDEHNDRIIAGGLSNFDIRAGSALIHEINRIFHEKNEKVPDEVLKNLAITSAVCRQLSGFDENAVLEVRFANAGIDTTALGKAIQADPSLSTALTKWMAGQLTKPETPAA